jgi:hypothetical protein
MLSFSSTIVGYCAFTKLDKVTKFSLAKLRFIYRCPVVVKAPFGKPAGGLLFKPAPVALGDGRNVDW